MGQKIFDPIPKRLVVLGALSLALAVGACAPSEVGGESATTHAASNPSAPPPPAAPVPAELQFKKIEGEFQQQNQQIGPKCPKHFKMSVQQNGQVSIYDQDGAQVFNGQASQQDWSPLAHSTNDIVSGGFERAQDCQSDASSDPYSSYLSDQQFYVTDREDRTDLISERRSDQFCDFSKRGKGKQIQSQMGKIAQDACNGKIQPMPEPRPTREPYPYPVPRPTRRPPRDSSDDSPYPRPRSSPYAEPTAEPRPSGPYSTPLPEQSPMPGESTGYPGLPR